MIFGKVRSKKLWELRKNRLITIPLLIVSFLLIVSSLVYLFGFRPEKGYGAGVDIEWHQYQHDAQNSGYTTVQVDPVAASSNRYLFHWAKLDDDDSNTITSADFDPNQAECFNGSAGPANCTITNGINEPLSTYVPNLVISNSVQPIVANDKVFIGGMSGKAYAFNISDGTTAWSHQLGGPIMGSTAFYNGIVMFGSLDGTIYAYNADSGTQAWTRTLNGPVSAHLKVDSGSLYIGTRAGRFYKIDATTGSITWQYDVAISGSTASPFALAPIVAPAAISTDGTRVVFVAENMRTYILNTSTGASTYVSSVMSGQSTALSVPVIHSGVVYIYTQSSLLGAEEESTDVESLYKDNIRSSYDWNSGQYTELLNPATPETRIAMENNLLRSYLSSDPNQKILHVFNISNGAFPFSEAVPMGRVTGNNWAPIPPVSTPDGLLTYWRSSFATFFRDYPPFGSIFCPDISYLNTTTGEREYIVTDASEGSKSCPELDNGFFLTKGGDRLYMQNSFRGVWTVDMSNSGDPHDVDGTFKRISTSFGRYDGGNFRSWGFDLIYYANDDTESDIRPIKPYDSTVYHGGVVPVLVNNQKYLVINDNGTDEGMTAGLVLVRGE